MSKRKNNDNDDSDIDAFWFLCGMGIYGFLVLAGLALLAFALN
jgi:hypothetical protein